MLKGTCLVDNKRKRSGGLGIFLSELLFLDVLQLYWQGRGVKRSVAREKSSGAAASPTSS